MSRYVLVHGAWHGAWCWERVVPFLTAGGHSVEAPDLVGTTLGDYVEQVTDLLGAGSGPAILAGHSLAGMVITRVAEQNPQMVESLVYVAAYLPADGQSVLSLAVRDGESLLVRGVETSPDGTLFTVDGELARRAMYEDCAPKDAAWAAGKLQPSSAAAFREPVNVTAARFGRVPRRYLMTMHDRAVTPMLQRRMVRATPTPVGVLGTGHSPFLANPELLAGHLLAAPAVV